MKLKSVKMVGIVVTLLLAGSSIAQEPADEEIAPNSRFSQQAFSQQLFEQMSLPDPQMACAYYGLENPCSFSRTHTFSDVELVHAQDSTRSTTKGIIPNAPVSREQALAYARILDPTAWIDHSVPSLQSEDVVYRGCTYYYGEPLDFNNYGHLCSAVMTLTPEGGVSSISISYFSP